MKSEFNYTIDELANNYIANWRGRDYDNTLYYIIYDTTGKDLTIKSKQTGRIWSDGLYNYSYLKALYIDDIFELIKINNIDKDKSIRELIEEFNSLII